MKNVSSRDVAIGVILALGIGAFVFSVTFDNDPYPYWSDDEIEARTYLDMWTADYDSDAIPSVERAACRYYRSEAWPYVDAMAALHKRAADAGDGSAGYYHSVANAMKRLNLVIETIALRDDFAFQVVATIEADSPKRFSNWGEAEHALYDAAIVAKKELLLSELCTFFIRD